MDGVTDWVHHELASRIGGVSLCVSEFVRVTEGAVPEKVLLRQVPELRRGRATRQGTPAFVQILGGARSPIASVLGSRQVGKTTLARMIATGRSTAMFDLEDPRSIARLEHPTSALEPLEGLVVIDEIQRQPELFSMLRVLADREPQRARFLILGSAAPNVVKGVSESLAGRVTFVDVGGFDLSEVGATSFEPLWLRGGFRRSFLAEDDAASMAWREDFIRTFLERDVAQLGISIPAQTLRRFWTMLAHCHGQVWNAAELARSLGASEGTARRYLDLLTSVFLVRQLPPVVRQHWKASGEIPESVS